MRILFSVRNPAYVRHYDSVLRALAARGHEVELVKQSAKHPWTSSTLTLADEHPAIRLSSLPEVANNPWWELATRLRQARFYLRFLEPAYAETPALLERARRRAPRLAIWVAESLGLGRFAPRLLARVVDVLEQSTRSATLFHGYLRERRPDVLVLTPLVVLKTTQLDLGRAATELGIRNVFAVASWDHLSSKGVLSFAPQRVFVWNDVQRREAIELHRVPADRVVMTGSQVFDHWFDRQPATTREQFCARVGLRPDRPFLLYVCSSLLEGSAPEPEFAIRWARHLRESGHPGLRECGILVRPHFRRGREWRGVSFGPLENIVCWPPSGEAPVDGPSRADYFDSMYHAAAVVGLNTSVMIEAAILGRSVHTVLVPQFRDSQEGTLHFHYLLDGQAPLVRSTRSLDEHMRDLAAVLDGRDTDTVNRSAQFVRTFVRPRGADTAATAVFVDELQALADAPAPAPVPVPVWARTIRPVIWPFAYAAAARVRRLRDERRRQKNEAILEHRRRKAAAALDN